MALAPFPFDPRPVRSTPMRRFFLLAALAATLATPAYGQLVLPGAAPDAAADTKPVAAPAEKPKPRPKAPKIESVLGQTLRLNGSAGELVLSADKPAVAPTEETKASDKKDRKKDKARVLRVERLSFLGEVISDPTQKCKIDIVADKPLQARSLGTPDGLARYGIDIPACPFSFDVVDGAVLAPQQTSACVFQAADCQANPGGLWGPDLSATDVDVKAIGKSRSASDAAIAETIKALTKLDKDGAIALGREESDFASQREDICRDYAQESRAGFCASRLTEARAALLRKRLADAKKSAADSEN